MFPLSDILQDSYSNYMFYIRKKTNFIINPCKTSQLRWFLEHIIKSYDYQQFLKNLNMEENKAFIHLLSQFCYSYESNHDQYIKQIEKKSMWIFKHPMGGFYIPAEFIKILMNEKSLLKERFLFSLLFKLSFKEQKDLTALIKSNYNFSSIITNEQNSWDMALVLYILFANFYTRGLSHKYIKAKQKILPIKNQISQSINFNHLLKQPTPMWTYLYPKFLHLHPALNEWQLIMKHSKKGFYRSLFFNLQAKKRINLFIFVWISHPHLTSLANKIDNIQLVTPTEVIHEYHSLSNLN